MQSENIFFYFHYMKQKFRTLFKTIYPLALSRFIFEMLQQEHGHSLQITRVGVY